MRRPSVARGETQERSGSNVESKGAGTSLDDDRALLDFLHTIDQVHLPTLSWAEMVNRKEINETGHCVFHPEELLLVVEAEETGRTCHSCSKEKKEVVRNFCPQCFGDCPLKGARSREFGAHAFDEIDWIDLIHLRGVS